MWGEALAALTGLVSSVTALVVAIGSLNKRLDIIIELAKRKSDGMVCRYPLEEHVESEARLSGATNRGRG